jgi:tetratricopeptide (TPR) repeat protein
MKNSFALIHNCLLCFFKKFMQVFMSLNMPIASKLDFPTTKASFQSFFLLENPPQNIWCLFVRYLSPVDIQNLVSVSRRVRDYTISGACTAKHQETLKFTERLISVLKSGKKYPNQVNRLEKLYNDFNMDICWSLCKLKDSILRRENLIIHALGMIINLRVIAAIKKISLPSFFQRFSSIIDVYGRVDLARNILSGVRQEEAFKKIFKDLADLNAISQMAQLPKTIVQNRDDIFLEIAGTLKGENDLKKRTFLIEQIEDIRKRRMAFLELSEAHRDHGALDSSRRALKIADFKEYSLTTNEEQIFQDNLQDAFAHGDLTEAKRMVTGLVVQEGVSAFSQIDAVEADKMPESLAKAEVYRDLAKYLADIGNFKKANEAALTAYRIIEKYPWNKMSFYLELSFVFIDTGRLDLVGRLVSSVFCNSINNQGLISIALRLVEVNRPDEARKILDRVTEFLYKSVIGWNTLSDEDFKHFFKAWAVIDFDKALEIACILPSGLMYDVALESTSLSLFAVKKSEEAKEAALMIGDEKIKDRLFEQLGILRPNSLKWKKEQIAGAENEKG